MVSLELNLALFQVLNSEVQAFFQKIIGILLVLVLRGSDASNSFGVIGGKHWVKYLFHAKSQFPRSKPFSVALENVELTTSLNKQKPPFSLAGIVFA